MAVSAPVLGTTQDAPRPITWTYDLIKEDEVKMQTAIQHFSDRTLVGRLVGTTPSHPTVREWMQSAQGSSTGRILELTMMGCPKIRFPVLYGDGSRPAVLQTAGITMPKAVMVMYTDRGKAVEAVERLRLTFPGIPIYARAEDLSHLLALKSAGATDAILENTETSLQLGSVLLRGLGVLSDDVSFLTRVMRESLELRARVALERQEEKDGAWLNSFQSWDARMQKQRLREPNRPSPKLRSVEAIPDQSDTEVVAEGSSNFNGSLSEHSTEIESSSEEHNLPELDHTESSKKKKPVELMTSDNADLSSIALNIEDRKAPWYQKLKFSHYDTSSGFLVPIPEEDLDSNEEDLDSRGVTWCAVSSEDGLEPNSPLEATSERNVEYISSLE
ncbi:hypothetical protein L7F22_062636 [Adiantum nelumboides]|nr:hypothetical protein [Adiantum nelumboides]